MQRSRFGSTQFGLFEEKSSYKAIICYSGGEMTQPPGFAPRRKEKGRSEEAKPNPQQTQEDARHREKSNAIKSWIKPKER